MTNFKYLYVVADDQMNFTGVRHNWGRRQELEWVPVYTDFDKAQLAAEKAHGGIVQLLPLEIQPAPQAAAPVPALPDNVIPFDRTQCSDVPTDVEDDSVPAFFREHHEPVPVESTGPRHLAVAALLLLGSTLVVQLGRWGVKKRISK